MPIFQKQIAFGRDGYPFSLAKKRAISYAKGNCPVVERLEGEELCLIDLIHPSMTESDLDDVFCAFEKVFAFKDELLQ